MIQRNVIQESDVVHVHLVYIGAPSFKFDLYNEEKVSQIVLTDPVHSDRRRESQYIIARKLN